MSGAVVVVVAFSRAVMSNVCALLTTLLPSTVFVVVAEFGPEQYTNHFALLFQAKTCGKWRNGGRNVKGNACDCGVAFKEKRFTEEELHTHTPEVSTIPPGSACVCVCETVTYL